MTTDKNVKIILSAFKDAIGEVRADIDSRFGEVRKEIGGVRADIDSHFGEVHNEITGLRTDMNTGFGEVKAEISATNARLGVVEERMGSLEDRMSKNEIRTDSLITMVRDFRKDVSGKFDDVGRYLRSINGSIADHEMRITALENPPKRIEDSG